MASCAQVAEHCRSGLYAAAIGQDIDQWQAISRPRAEAEGVACRRGCDGKTAGPAPLSLRSTWTH